MLDKVIRLSLQNRLVTLFSAAAVLAGGIYSAVTIPIDVFPDLTAPTVTVLTEAHGMAAEEVELLVTFPIETAVNGAAGVRRVLTLGPSDGEWTLVASGIRSGERVVTEGAYQVRLASLNASEIADHGHPH